MTNRIEFIIGKNTDLDFRLRIWLLFRPNLSKKTNKCESDENDSNNNQISKYDYSIMARMKSTETKQVLKDITKQTWYNKTRSNSGT